MSAIISGRVYWTEFKELCYTNKSKKEICIKETTAKIVMLAIADSADDFGENSWNSFETLATKTSIQRRSVIRVTRALINHNYLKVAGASRYGTNNFSINLALLGQPPVKRAKNGRPKTSDSDVFTGDSGTKTGDSQSKTSDGQSPDPSYIPPETPETVPPVDSSLSEIEEAAKKKVDNWLLLMKSPGLKNSARVDAILSYLGGAFQINTETKRWKDFAKFVDDRQRQMGQNVETFVTWLKSQKDFDIKFWSPQRMTEMYPQAFIVPVADTHSEAEYEAARAEFRRHAAQQGAQ